jgi:hypothetical protein
MAWWVSNGSILENEALAAPYMYYLFYRIQSQLRAQKEQNGTVSPTFIYVPEMWYFIRNEMFQGKFFEFLVTLRKLLGVVWLDTQSPDQLVASKIYSALRDNIATTVFTPNRKALTSSLGTLYRDEFLLSQEELQAIADGTRKRDYFIKQGGLAPGLAGLAPRCGCRVAQRQARPAPDRPAPGQRPRGLAVQLHLGDQPCVIAIRAWWPSPACSPR